jgi:hypothetical protein
LIDVSDVVPAPDFPAIPVYRRPRERAVMLDMLVNRTDVTQLNMSKLDISDAARSFERTAIVKAIEGFVQFFDAAALARLKGQSDESARARDAAFEPPTRLVRRLTDLLREEITPTSLPLSEATNERVKKLAEQSAQMETNSVYPPRRAKLG